MEYIHFNDTISSDTFQELLERVNSVENDDITLYLSSTGGDISIIPLMLDLINNRIHTLNLYGNIFSSTFVIALMANPTKLVYSKLCRFMYHRFKVSYAELNYNYEYEFKDGETDSVSKAVEFFLDIESVLELTEKEKEAVKNGGDIFIPVEKFSKIRKNCTEKFGINPINNYICTIIN